MISWEKAQHSHALVLGGGFGAKAKERFSEEIHRRATALRKPVSKVWSARYPKMKFNWHWQGSSFGASVMYNEDMSDNE